MSVDIVTEAFPEVDQVIDKAHGPQGPPAGQWVDSRTYPAGSEVTRQKAGVWYDWIAVQATTGDDPATDDGTNWTQGDVITVRGIQFDISETAPTAAPGTIGWNPTDGTFDLGTSIPDVVVQAGQELQTPPAKNTTGDQIDNADCVYVSGSTGANPEFGLARADSPSTQEVIAVATHDIANNDFGLATAFGMVRAFNTSAWVAGTILYLSPTIAGGLTDVMPVSPNLAIRIGVVIRSHANLGSIFVAIGPEHDQFVRKLNGVVTGLTVTGGTETVTAVASGATMTLDMDAGPRHNMNTQDEDVTIALSNAATGKSASAALKQDGTGGWTISVPGAWIPSITPSPTTTAGEWNFLEVWQDGSDVFYTLKGQA